MDETIDYLTLTEQEYKKRLQIVLNTIKNSTVEDIREVIEAIEKDEGLHNE